MANPYKNVSEKDAKKYILIASLEIFTNLKKFR